MKKLVLGLSLALCAVTAQAQDNCDLEKAAKTAVIKSETGVKVSKCTAAKATGVDDAVENTKNRVEDGKKSIKNKKEGLVDKKDNLLNKKSSTNTDVTDRIQNKASEGKVKLNKSVEKVNKALDNPVSAAVKTLAQ